MNVFGSPALTNAPNCEGCGSVQETPVQSLGWEDLPEKEMATHSSILAWKIPWMKGEPGRLQLMGSQSRTRLHFHFHICLIQVLSAGRNSI